MTCHRSEIPKLNRVAGQIDGIKTMIEDGRYCPDILTQLRAAKSALRSIESRVLERHLQACVQAALSKGNKKEAKKHIDEISKIFRRFDGQ